MKHCLNYFLTSFTVFTLVLGCSSAPNGKRKFYSEVGYLRQSQKEESDSIRLLRSQSYQSYIKGDFVKAISGFESYLILDSQNVDRQTKYVLTHCYLSVGEYKKALELAQSLVQQDPYDFLGYQQVGLAQLWLGSTQTALESFKRGLEFDSHLPRLHFYEGLVYERLGKVERKEAAFKLAEKEYKEILAANPYDFVASYELAYLYLYWKHKLDAVSGLIRGAKESLAEHSEEQFLQGKDIYLSFYLPMLEGIHLFFQGDPEGSLNQLIQSLTNAPTGLKADVAEIYYYMGQDYLLMGKLAEASSFLKKSKGLDPTGAYAKKTSRILRKLASGE